MSRRVATKRALIRTKCWSTSATSRSYPALSPWSSSGGLALRRPKRPTSTVATSGGRIVVLAGGKQGDVRADCGGDGTPAGGSVGRGGDLKSRREELCA